MTRICPKNVAGYFLQYDHDPISFEDICHLSCVLRVCTKNMEEK